MGVTILGCNSAVPAHGRHPTAQILTVENNCYLIDCGEATQIQMQRFKVRRSRIKAIFISHLHGDHYFGLVGLICSFGLMGRKDALTIYGPGNLAQIIHLQLEAANVELPYVLIFEHVTAAGTIYTDNHITVTCFPTDHRIECFGYKFTENKKLRKINIEAAKQYAIPVSFFKNLKQGESYIQKDGAIVQNEALTYEPSSARSYAYTADTRYHEEIIPFIENVDLMYHETTYLNNGKQRAMERYHSTTTDAANMAILSKAKRLLIGHFSSKYETVELFQKEAQLLFANTCTATEGVTYLI
jgi:ribonuclease Z